jgi:hypothetical protein
MKYEVKRTDPFMVRAVGAYKPFAIRFRGALPHAGMRAGRWPTTFNIQHSTFNIQHSTFNIQHSTFNIERPGKLDVVPYK